MIWELNKQEWKLPWENKGRDCSCADPTRSATINQKLRDTRKMSGLEHLEGVSSTLYFDLKRLASTTIKEKFYCFKP